MAIINPVGNALKGITGSGLFVGATAPVMTLPSANSFISGYTTTVTSATPVVLIVSSNYQQFFTGSTAQTLTMPVATTLVEGQAWWVVNNSSATLTVQSSGGNTIVSMPAGTNSTITCILNSGTSAASWNAEEASDVAGVTSITGTANQIIASAATGAVTLSLPSNIANSISIVNIQVFTINGTYTPTSGMKYCVVEAVGGGGGGGASTTCSSTQVSAGGGGGGGQYTRSVFSAATIGASTAIVIGAGGNGGTAPGGNGGNGGTTTFGSTLLTAIGGGGGIGMAAVTAANAAGGAGGSGGTGTFSTVGANGVISLANYVATAFVAIGGAGGDSVYGNGGSQFPLIGTIGGATSGAGGSGYGAGGSGGETAISGNGATGGSATNGIIIITEYC